VCFGILTRINIHETFKEVLPLNTALRPSPSAGSNNLPFVSNDVKKSAKYLLGAFL